MARNDWRNYNLVTISMLAVGFFCIINIFKNVTSVITVVSNALALGLIGYYFWRFEKNNIKKLAIKATSTEKKKETILHHLVTSKNQLIKYLFFVSFAIFIAMNIFMGEKNLSTIPLIISLASITFTLFNEKKRHNLNIFQKHPPNHPETDTKKGFTITIIIISTILFLILGLNHLGKFMSVDEPKWVNTRVPQLFEALRTGDIANTYINDKPGILPAFLSGTVNFFLDHDLYKNNPLEYEEYLFWWRLPILIFNFLSLFVIFCLTKKLFDRNIANLTIVLIALNPIIIGISQIVNPDSTLWNTTFISLLSFFLFLKTEEKKYIWWTGIALGLALTSKYFAALLYLIYFIAMYFEYIYKEESIGVFFSKIISLGKMTIVSIATFTVLFPATWLSPELIIRGTVGAPILASGAIIFFLIIYVIFFDLLLLQSKISNVLKKAFGAKSLSIRITSGLLLSIFLLLTINILTNNSFFDFNDYLLNEYLSRSPNFLKNLFSSVYATMLTSTYPLLLAGFFFLPILFLKKFTGKETVIIFTLQTLIIVFLLGSALGGFIANARYQIILYAPLALLTAIAVSSLFHNKKTKAITIVLGLISLTACLTASPFYYHYSNGLNIKDYIITEAWGFGGYELAQIANQLPNADNLSVWADREGFNEFFIGNKTWRSQMSPLEYPFNYFVLTPFGERILSKNPSYYNFKKNNNGNTNRINPEAREIDKILTIYNSLPPYSEICIGNNNCIRLVENKKIQPDPNTQTSP